MANQNPYPISGVFDYERPKGAASTNGEGARVWIKDIDDEKIPISITEGEDVRATATNSSGQWLLDLANITTAYADGDDFIVYLEYQGNYLIGTGIVDIGTGSSTVNLTMYIRSGLKDGVGNTVSASQSEFGAKKLGTGMRVGLKSGLVS